MAKVFVSLLGTPQVKCEQQVVEIGHRKSTALLIYLLMTKQTHSRDALAELLWPDASPASGLGNLRRAIYLVNQKVGQPLLAATRAAVSINPQVDMWMDVDVFQLAANQGFDRQDEPSIPGLEEAAALYNGDFLAGFSLPDCPAFDEWQFFQSGSLKRLFGMVLDQLTTIYEKNGEWEKAIFHQRKLLSLDPLSETVSRRIMSLYARNQQPIAALRLFEELRRRLNKEINVTPEPETIALFEAIKTRQFAGSFPASAPAAIQADPQFERGQTPQHNLPIHPSPFVGRKWELEQVGSMLSQACEYRLLTITGPGGIGKTRLAIEAAEKVLPIFPGGIYLIHSGQHQPEHALASIGEQLGIRFHNQNDIKQQILGFIGDRSILLVLDNFESSTTLAEIITEFLEQAPKLKVLVTAPERLNLSCEQVFPLMGMPYPDQDDADNLEDYEAVQLLIQLAKLARPGQPINEPDLPYLARICRLVGGMPLALVLAASWLELLSFQEIAGEIAHNLDFLQGTYHDLPERQHSVRAAFETSWVRLTQQEQQSLLRMTVFKSGFTRQAAQAVSGAQLPTLRKLLDKSLIYVTDASRYDLYPILNQFAAEKMPPEESEQIRTQHSAYYLDLLARLEEDILGQRQIDALSEVEADLENIRGAWNTALNQQDFDRTRLAAESLYLFFTFRSRYQEGAEVFHLANQVLSAHDCAETQTTLDRITARMLWFQTMLGSSGKSSKSLIQDLIRRNRKRKDRRELAFCLLLLGCHILYTEQDSANALTWFEQSLDIYRRIDLSFYITVGLLWLGTCHGDATHIDNLLHFTRQSLDLARETGNLLLIPYALRNLALGGLCCGDYGTTEDYCNEALIINTQMQFPLGVADAKTMLGLLYFLRGELDLAWSLAEEGLKIATEVSFPATILEAQSILSLIAALTGNLEQGQQLASASHLPPASHFGTILSKWTNATLSYFLAEYNQAGQYLSEAMELANRHSYRAVIAWLLPQAALIAYHQGDARKAAQNYHDGVNHPHQVPGWIAFWDQHNLFPARFIADVQQLASQPDSDPGSLTNPGAAAFPL